MLPHYADGSKKDTKTKKIPLSQLFIVFAVLCWVLFVLFYLRRKNGSEAGAFFGLATLVPTSWKRLWFDKVNSFFRSIEDSYPIEGWDDETQKGIGKYTDGEYLEQIRVREREIAEEIALAHILQNKVGSINSLVEEEMVSESGSALPAGSYKGSCDGCVVMGVSPHQQLKCNCRDSQGQTNPSVFRLDCKENEWVGNMDGVLACELTPDAADAIKISREKEAEKLAAEKAQAFAAERTKYLQYEESMQQAMEIKHKTKPGTIFDFFGFIPARWEI